MRYLALQTQTNVLSHLWHTLRRPAYQTGLLATLLLTGGGGLLAPFGSAFLINNVHLASAQLPLVYLLAGLSSLVVIPLVGKLSDRVSRFKLFAAGAALAIGAGLVYTHLGPTPLWKVSLLNALLFSRTMSWIVPAMALNTSLSALADRGAYPLCWAFCWFTALANSWPVSRRRAQRRWRCWPRRWRNEGREGVAYSPTI